MNPLQTTLLALAVLAGAAQAAPSGYEIFTSAATTDTSGAYAFAGYNADYSADGNAANMNRYNDAQAHAFCTAPGCESANQGTTANAGAGAATMAQSSSSLATAYWNIGGDPVPSAAASWAWVDLATGRLGASASGQQRATGRPFVEGTFGVAKGRMADTLSFTVAAADANTTTRVGISFDIDGSFTAGSAGAVRWWFTLGQGLAYGSVVEGQAPNVAAQGAFAPGSGYRVVQPGHIVFDGWLEFTGPSADVGVALDLWAFGGSSGITDWAHTGAIALSLPPGVGMTSASGVFLTASPVPELPVPAMMLLGLMAVGGWMRWRMS